MVVFPKFLYYLLVKVHVFFGLIIHHHALHEHHRKQLLDLLEFAETRLYVLPIYRVHDLQAQTSLHTSIPFLFPFPNLNPSLHLQIFRQKYLILFRVKILRIILQYLNYIAALIIILQHLTYRLLPALQPLNLVKQATDDHQKQTIRTYPPAVVFVQPVIP